MGVDLLWMIFDLLPLVFAVDLLAFHATGDHPLALRWWWRRETTTDHDRTQLCGLAEVDGQ